MEEAEWTEVDGVAVLHYPRGVVPEPLAAGLVFGVGRADEPLVRTGVTHLVEHLALNAVLTDGHPKNGEVRTGSTTFTASGRPEQIVTFLAAVAAALGALPVDDLAHELRILEIEEVQRGTGHMGRDLSARFGPNGPGVVGWSEFGPLTLGPDDVRAWCEHWFTASNAVLWLSGPVPDGLTLAGLPDGPRPARAPVPTYFTPGRSYIDLDTTLASVSVVTGQEWGSGLALSALCERAFACLRTERALSYSVDLVTARLGGGYLLRQVVADGAPGTGAERAAILMDLLDELAADGVGKDELDRCCAHLEAYPDHPSMALGYLDGAAERHVMGLPLLTRAGSLAANRAATAESTAADLAACAGTFLAMASGDRPDRDGWTSYQRWSPEVLDGTVYRPITGREDGTLVLGPDGLTWGPEDERRRVVRWPETVACLRWTDGVRRLVAPDGAAITVVPRAWRNAGDIDRQIDGYVPAAVVVDIHWPFLDPEDDNDPLWLCTVLDARVGLRRADVVVSTGGILLLPRRAAVAPSAARLQHYRTSSVGTLLDHHSGGRFIGVDAVTSVTLQPRAAGGRPTVRWVIRHGDGQRTSLVIPSGRQATVVRDAMRQLVDDRFTYSGLIAFR